MQLDLALFQTASAPQPRVHTVTEVTRRLRELIEHGMGELWVEGEVSNLRRQSSGHQYFTLKDDSCQLHCVLFSGTAASLDRIPLADGQCVQVLGLHRRGLMETISKWTEKVDGFFNQLALEIWGRLFFFNESIAELTDRINCLPKTMSGAREKTK